MNVQTFRDEIPHIAAGYVHLNHAGVTAVSQRVVDKVNECLLLSSQSDPLLFLKLRDGAAICRTLLASLLGVDPANVAFTKNTAHGISIIADGFKWQAGDEVIFADCEYPANTYPWMAQEDRGVVCKIINTESDGTISLDSYRQAITKRTRMIAVSWVQFSTGFRSDLAALTSLAHENGARILVDVIQGLGALPLNLNELGVDYAATGSQKWLLGPMGVGGLYVHPEALDDLRLVNMGAGSVKNVYGFEPLVFEPKSTVQRYEEGTPNYFGIIGLGASLSMLADAGPLLIEESIRDTTVYAARSLESVGYTVVSPKDWAKSAGIVLFKHPTIPNKQVLEALEANKVIVVARGGKVRFAPHFYNTREDIDRAVAALPAL